MNPCPWKTKNRGNLIPLAGPGVWADLRVLAETYLDGSQSHGTMERPTLTAATARPPTTAVKMTQGRLNVIRQIERRKPLGETSGDFAHIVADAEDLTIYLDEVWSVESLGGRRNEGVIAGLICRGRPLESYALPRLKTHAYKRPSEALAALQALWSCPFCAPVLFPLQLPDPDEPASRYYDELLQLSIRFLLGWLLPTPDRSVRVWLFPEAMEQCFHPSGDDGSEFYRGLLSADAGRFGHWQIAMVRWEEKNFGYIPYADLVGHLTLEHTPYNQALGEWANFKHLPGYVPFSVGLVPRLERLEHLEISANLQDVIDFAMETSGSRFGELVLRDIAGRLAPRADLQVRLLETLEAGYRDKIRDLARLRRAFAAVRSLLPELPAGARPPMRLLWYLLALQDANHDGDPARTRAVASEYRRERARLMQVDRELCAYADLNLAVHEADRFAFADAEALIEEWVDDPLFNALSVHQQARMYSALGQTRAILGDATGADALFAAALTLFEHAPLDESERARECEQTGIYRALNALDGELGHARQAVEAVLGSLTVATAVRFATDAELENQYRHHLWVRALYQLHALGSARDAYLDAASNWCAGFPQHPWPSIHGHRGFLLWNRGDESWEALALARAAFDQALTVADMAEHGATMKLIGGLWATVAACCFANAGYEERANAFLEQSRSLVDARDCIAILTDLLVNPEPQAIPDALAALPFSYR